MKSKLTGGRFLLRLLAALAFLAILIVTGALCMGIADVFKARPGIDGVSS